MTQQLLFELAKSKGFNPFSDDITGDFLALCGIQKWLMDVHDIYIAALPFFGGFSYIAAKRDKNAAPYSFNLGSYKTWNEAYIQALEEALKLI